MSELSPQGFLAFFPKPSLKIGSVNKAVLFWYWQQSKNTFFVNKTFLFFNIESWNFQVQFEIEFRETSQHFNSLSLFRQLLFSSFLSVVWLSWNFCEISQFFFKKEVETFRIFLKKNFVNLTKFQLNQTTNRKNGNKNCLNTLNEFTYFDLWLSCFWMELKNILCIFCFQHTVTWLGSASNSLALGKRNKSPTMYFYTTFE